MAADFSFLILVLLVTLLLEGFSGFAKPVGAVAEDTFGFEDGLLGWHYGGEVSASRWAYGSRDEYTEWIVGSFEDLMGEVRPSASFPGFTLSSVLDELWISEIYRTYLQTWFPPATNISYVFKDVELLAGESFSVAWNYLARDSAPFIDPSFCSMVNLDQLSDIPTVDGYISQIAMLGSVVPGSSNYPTGNFGCTGWQTMTFQASGAGTYRVGFVVFNSRDALKSPSLLIDQLPGTTMSGSDYYAPISRATDGPPPPMPMAPMVVSSPADEITSESATLHGSVTYDGLSAVTERGFAIGFNHNPTIDGSKLTAGAGAGSFSSTVTGLTQGVTYHYRAYAINGVGVSYGADTTFTTKRRHIVIFPALSDAIYGDADISGFAFILSGYALTYESNDPDVAVIVDDRIHITGAGTT
ncbi:MAG: hypothetical protein GX153_10765, partial [Clostridiaceae bacterium]|nr:hypothetical protein [Clostridiaceae bacterium]